MLVESMLKLEKGYDQTGSEELERSNVVSDEALGDLLRCSVGANARILRQRLELMGRSFVDVASWRARKVSVASRFGYRQM